MSEPEAEPEAEPEPFVFSEEVARAFINEFVAELADRLICSTIAEASTQVGHGFSDEQMDEYLEVGQKCQTPPWTRVRELLRGPGSSLLKS